MGAVNRCVQFHLHAMLKRALPEAPGGRLFARDFAAGGLAGLAATVSVYPFDVLRTRFVAQHEPRVRGRGPRLGRGGSANTRPWAPGSLLRPCTRCCAI
jgi:hypothetical protein